jgi:hypothetical protein
MKKLFLLVTIVALTACCNCNNRYKHQIGDVTEYKLNTTRVLILDTLYKIDKPYYKVKTDEGWTGEVDEQELESKNYN